MHNLDGPRITKPSLRMASSTLWMLWRLAFKPLFKEARTYWRLPRTYASPPQKNRNMIYRCMPGRFKCCPNAWALHR
eukprot:12410214-Karenia_brevis.AAC.1